MDAISERAQISKPKLHRYYKTKRILFLAVLNRVLDRWLAPLATLDADGDPATEIERYIANKLEFTCRYPTASRVFANEILHGAPELSTYLRTELKARVDSKAEVIAAWMRAGKLAEVDPRHLIFLIWAATQHYADFAPQVEALLGTKRLDRAQFAEVGRSLAAIVLGGIVPRARVVPK